MLDTSRESQFKLLFLLDGVVLNSISHEDSIIKDDTKNTKKLRKAVGASSTGATKNSRLEELRKKAGMNK